MKQAFYAVLLGLTVFCLGAQANEVKDLAIKIQVRLHCVCNGEAKNHNKTFQYTVVDLDDFRKFEQLAQRAVVRKFDNCLCQPEDDAEFTLRFINTLKRGTN